MKTELRKGPAIHVEPYGTHVKDNQWNPDRREVRVMCWAEGYAMVRRPRALPYVVPIREIEQPPK